MALTIDHAASSLQDMFAPYGKPAAVRRIYFKATIVKDSRHKSLISLGVVADSAYRIIRFKAASN